MSLISRTWEGIRREPSKVHHAFWIPAERIIDQTIEETPFSADEAYFELRLAEQFLRDRREYHLEFIPVTLVLSEFIYERERRSFPFIVGPSLLEGLKQLDGNEHIRYRNTRVAGPIPYRGDDVNLFVGLFRVKSKDWAVQALTLLESVANVFDTSRLTQFLSLTAPLIDSIEGFLGMGDDMQFRVGQRDAFTDQASNNASTRFRPGYYAMIRSDVEDIDRDHFWVKENQLFYGTQPDQLQLYRDMDYILFHVNKLELRNDYTTFDFHREWLNAQENLWNEDRKGALNRLRRLTFMIKQSPDLIPEHREALIAMYRRRFKEDDEVVSSGFESPGLRASRTISEKTIQEILTSSQPIEPVDLED